jgi:integrase
MKEIKASIIDRSGRPFWYIRYGKKEISTKVLKSEKSRKWMQQQYLPAFIANVLNKEEDKAQKAAAHKMTFQYFAELFVRGYEKNYDFQNMKYRLDRILPDFRDRKINEITKLDVRQFCELLRNGNTGNEISKNSKLKYLRIFRGIFELAVEAEIIEKNPADKIKFAGDSQNLEAVEPFLKEEVQVLLEKSKDTERYGELLHLYLGVAFSQGMSPAEIIGLQIGDIDLNKQVISIKRNLTKGNVKVTKTLYRVRDIVLFSAALPFFDILVAKAKQKKSIWLFSKEDGQRLDDIEQIRGDRLIIKDGRKIKNNTRWALLLNDCGIKYRDLKNCRHTFAVSALESKVFTPQEVANILGHSSLQMLIKHYARYINNKALSANREIDLFSDTLSDTSKTRIKND